MFAIFVKAKLQKCSQKKKQDLPKKLQEKYSVYNFLGNEVKVLYEEVGKLL